jgi:hypothetical protein
LCDTQAAGGFDRLRAGGAVRARPGKNHNDGFLFLLDGEGAKEVIHRSPMAPPLRRFAQPEHCFGQRHREAGRMTYTVSGSMRMPSSISSTCIEVHRPRISAIKLRESGGKCWMTT